MVLLRYFLYRAARRIASDPHMQARVAEVVEREVKPRAEAAWRQAKPKLDSAREEVRSAAAETDPRLNPGAFAANIAKRMARRRR
jgi:hypothetical protein